MKTLDIKYPKFEVIEDVKIKEILDKHMIKNITAENVIILEMIELNDRNTYLKIIRRGENKAIIADEIYAMIHDNDFVTHGFREMTLYTNIIYAQKQQEILHRIKSEKEIDVESISREKGIRYVNKKYYQLLSTTLSNGGK